MLKYAFYIGLVLNFVNIQSMIFDFFIGIAKVFGADVTNANQAWQVSIKEAEKLFNLIVSYHQKADMTKWILLPDIFTIMIALFIMFIVGIRIVLEIMMATVQFFLTTTLALFFVIFDVLKKPSGLQNKLPITFILSGIKITVITVVFSVIIGALNSVDITVDTDNLDAIKDAYEGIFRYIGLMIIGIILISKSSKFVTKEFR